MVFTRVISFLCSSARCFRGRLHLFVINLMSDWVRLFLINGELVHLLEAVSGTILSADMWF